LNQHSEFYNELGLAVSIICNCENRLKLPILAIKIWLEPAVLHGQIKFIYDKYSRPIGYFTWAKLSNKLIADLKKYPNKILHISEWNEGNYIFIVDFIFESNSKFLALREIARSFTQEPIIYWRHSEKVILSRTRRNSILTEAHP
jgi:hemolysin-activating ACP:hemolysin acyltransferase